MKITEAIIDAETSRREFQYRKYPHVQSVINREQTPLWLTTAVERLSISPSLAL